METGVFAMFPLRLQPHSAARGSLLDHRRRHGQIADHGDRTSHTFQPIRKSAVVVILIPKVEDEQNDLRCDKDAHFISLLPSAHLIELSRGFPQGDVQPSRARSYSKRSSI